MAKTSTFTIDHDKCDPRTWTPHDVLALSDFIRTGSMVMAARLARLGVQLVLSEHHSPKGGELEHVGWVLPGDLDVHEIDEVTDDDVTEAHPIFRGKVEYIARIATGDGDGNFDGYIYEIKPTLEEARACLPTADDAEVS